MTRRRTVAFAGSIVTAACAVLPSGALAATSFSALPELGKASVGSPSVQCGQLVNPASGIVSPMASIRSLSKSAAILGGRPSRLEAITSQQGGGISTTFAWAPAPTALTLPAIIGLPDDQPCSLAMPSKTVLTFGGTIQTVQPSGDDFLGSKRLRIRHTGFDAAWTRVANGRLPRGIVAGLARVTAGHATLSTLAAVNSWANGRIRYVDDKHLYGKEDYWASAGTTLRLGAGDCEDIAIAKMQLLAALGVARSEMFLTVARDLARNADHAILIVRLDGRNWLLDNSTNELLDASSSHDYRPIMSFSASGKWLHGFASLN